VTSQFGESQLGDVKSVTGVSHFGDIHNVLPNDIFPFSNHLAYAYTSQNLL